MDEKNLLEKSSGSPDAEAPDPFNVENLRISQDFAAAAGVKQVIAMSKLAIICIRAYQWFISPMLHTLMPVRTGCRFPRTCSEYFVHALKDEGFTSGIRSGAARIIQCHPLKHS